MESLALLVGGMFLAEIALAVITVVFAAIYRARGKFRLTTTILIGMLSAWTIWALVLSPAFGYPPLAGVLLAALLRFAPKRGR